MEQCTPSLCSWELCPGWGSCLRCSSASSDSGRSLVLSCGIGTIYLTDTPLHSCTDNRGKSPGNSSCRRSTIDKKSKTASRSWGQSNRMPRCFERVSCSFWKWQPGFSSWASILFDICPYRGHKACSGFQSTFLSTQDLLRQRSRLLGNSFGFLQPFPSRSSSLRALCSFSVYGGLVP